LHRTRHLQPGHAQRAVFQSLEAAGPSLGIEAVQTPVRNAAEIERALASFNGEANVGLGASGSNLGCNDTR
jgi:hypothetical protein